MIKNYGGRKLSKTGAHRRSMFSNMMTSLIMNEKIITTNAKAKELRRFFDKMMNYAKNNQYSILKSMVRDKDAFKRLSMSLFRDLEKETRGIPLLLMLVGERAITPLLL
jgi:ribosomal protein L17